MAARREHAGKGDTVPVRGESGPSTRRDEINRLFDRFPGGGRRTDPWPESWSQDAFADPEWPGGALGRADLSETDDGYELQLDLPGMKKDEVSVDLSDGVLTISGVRSDEREDKRKGYYLSERSHGSLRRSFRVPDSVDLDRIEGQFKDGVLTLTLPRSEQAQKHTRRIEVG